MTQQRSGDVALVCHDELWACACAYACALGCLDFLWWYSVGYEVLGDVVDHHRGIAGISFGFILDFDLNRHFAHVYSVDYEPGSEALD